MPERRRPIASLMYPEDKVRKFVGVAGVSVGLLAAACTGAERSVDEGLRMDLELASTASPITLASSPQGAQVVSAIERTAPAPKRVAPSQRAVRHTPAPSRIEAPVEVEAADVAEEVEPAPVDVAEVPEEVAPVPSARPRPVESPGTGGGGYGDIGAGRGETVGTIIAVVLRGGHAGIDDCDPRVDGRRGRRGGGHIAINNRIPVVGTFPAGRIQGTFPGSGRLSSGRVRF